MKGEKRDGKQMPHIAMFANMAMCDTLMALADCQSSGGSIFLGEGSTY